MTNFAPRTALVTGASSGIGRGVALALAGKGVRVIAARQRIEALDWLASESGGRIAALELDVTDVAHLAPLHRRLDKFDAKIDLLANNAGYP